MKRISIVLAATILCISMTACMRREDTASSQDDMIIEQPPISRIEPPDTTEPVIEENPLPPLGQPQ